MEQHTSKIKPFYSMLKQQIIINNSNKTLKNYKKNAGKMLKQLLIGLMKQLFMMTKKTNSIQNLSIEMIAKK